MSALWILARNVNNHHENGYGFDEPQEEATDCFASNLKDHECEHVEIEKGKLFVAIVFLGDALRQLFAVDGCGVECAGHRNSRNLHSIFYIRTKTVTLALNYSHIWIRFPKKRPHTLEIGCKRYLFFCFSHFFMFYFLIIQVSCKLETAAVSQLVCFTDLSIPEILRRQALNTNLSSSHSHKNCLFFLVNGRRNR